MVDFIGHSVELFKAALEKVGTLFCKDSLAIGIDGSSQNYQSGQ